MNEFPGYDGYDKEQEQMMRVYFRSLPEDHRRRYAAVEAHKIGFGGVSYISDTLEAVLKPLSWRDTAL